MEHESDGDTIVICALQNSHQKIGTGTGGDGNKRTYRDSLNYSIIKIGQNTKKSHRVWGLLVSRKLQW